MSTNLQNALALFGRILISAIFLLSGLNKAMDWSSNAQYMAQHNLPAISLLLTAAIVVEILGGLAILVGFQTRVVAFVLFLYVIPTTLIFHNFWAITDPMQHQDMMIHFLKNLAIMGGLVNFSASGAGAFSVDAHLPRPAIAPGFFSRSGQRPAS